MDFFSVINVALPVIYVLVGIVLVWFVIELVMTVRKTRETVTSVQKQLEPTLEHVEKITASLEPVCDKIDPLVDRVSLTVNAANLEVMRLRSDSRGRGGNHQLGIECRERGRYGGQCAPRARQLRHQEGPSEIHAEKGIRRVCRLRAGRT